MSCKYYGCAAARELKTLISKGGNQCAVQMHKHAPCEMELAGKAPEHSACPLAPIGDKLFEGWPTETLKVIPSNVTTPSVMEFAGVKRWSEDIENGPYKTSPVTDEDRRRFPGQQILGNYQLDSLKGIK
jgi:hypothetical protein